MEIRALLPSRDEVESVVGRSLKELPSLPVVAAKLLQMTRDERLSTADIAKVVETDPTIATKVLRIVNSAAFGTLRRISSIRHAVVLLGTSEVRAVALGVTLFENVVKRRRKSDFDRLYFWKHCLAIAGLCRALAEETGYPDPEEAYVAGLLHDFGKIILDSTRKVRYGKFLKDLGGDAGPIVDKEREQLGLGHDQIGAYFCETWNMPQRLVLSQLLHHRRFSHLGLNPDAALLVAIVSLADFIAWTQGVGSVDALRHPMLHPDVEAQIRIDKLQLTSLMSRMDREVTGTSEFYGFTFPSADQLRENLLRTNIELGQVHTRYFHQHGDLKKEIQSLTILKESLTTPHRSLSPKEIMSSTLTAVQRGFDFDRLFVLRIDPVDRHLAAVASLDTTEIGVDLNQLDIRIEAPTGGFIDCLRNNMPALITGVNDDEQRVLDFLKARELGIVPYSIHKRVMGILGVDNAVSGRMIHFADLTALTLVANELGMALEKARAFEEIQNRASYDGLTGVYNRSSIESVLKKAFQKARSAGRSLSVAMVDVDHFKAFNDTFGHLAGDSILKLLAGSLLKFSRPTEVVGRYGGEEFLCVLKDTDLNGALMYGERIREKIESLGLLLLDRFPGHPLTISIGTAELTEGIASDKELVDRADQALYRAKGGGRNRVVSADR